jgi:MarR family transcriptional regulator, organic hydroperoxide resistance regulator
MKKNKSDETRNILRHWQEAVPNDRLAHLVRDAGRAYTRALQLRLADHGVPFGHWTFLRILWDNDGLTQRELSDRAGVMEPTTFTAMKNMEALGYIERRQLKKKLVPLAERTNQVSVQGLRESDIQTTRRVLLTILSNLAHDEPN